MYFVVFQEVLNDISNIRLRDKICNEKKDEENQNQDNGQDGPNDQDAQDRNEQEAEQGQKSDQPENGRNKGQYAGASEEYKAGDMSRNEAEAFLDNIGEDPSEINRFRFRGKERLPLSGKDW